MRVAIVDDNEDMLNIIRKHIFNYMSGCVCDVFQKEHWIKDKIEEGYKYDIYFLDIEMPEISGLELAKWIRKMHKTAYIVFLTSYPDYALQSYDIEIKAYQYILKEEMEQKIIEVMQEISFELEERKTNYYIIQNKFHYERIKVIDIIYIYKEEKYSVFITNDGIYRERIAINKVMKILAKPEFIFVDSGRIVNIRFIRRIDGDTIILMDGTKLYAGRVSIRKVKDNISSYWRDFL